MIDKLSQKNSDADNSYKRLTRRLRFGWQSPLVLLGLTIALCNPLTLNASVSAFIESIKTEIKDKNLSEKEAKSVVAEKCLSLANVATLFPPDESKDSSGNKIVTKGSQEKCVETGMNIANRYT